MITHPNVKLNLGLNVLRKRSDGYHDLETLFVPYTGVTDTLEIVTADDYSRTLPSMQQRFGALAQAISPDGKLMISIARREGVQWDPLKDITARAYSILDRDFGLPSMKIFLEKNNPVGAGLGGGSADAAFALGMISELAGLGLDKSALASYAALLGSDCPFFIYNRPMLGSGRGEVLEPFDIDMGRFRIELTVPEGISVSTAEAYAGITPHLPAKPLREVLSGDIGLWKEDLCNDFEAGVFARYPSIAQEKQKLYDKGAVYASMSGSGSAIFGFFL